MLGSRIASRAGLATILALTFLGVETHAQTRDPVAAEALFRAGRDAVKKSDYASACPKFADSFELDPSPGTLLNLADCEEHVGKIASAWQHYQALVQDLPSNDERYTFARDRIKVIEPRLPRITVKLAAKAPADAKVTRDGIALGGATLGFALPVDPGDHEFVVRAPGYKERRYTTTIKEEESKEIEVDVGEKLPDEAPPVPTATGPAATSTGAVTPPPQVDQGSSGQRTAGIVSLALGGAGIAVGAVTGFLVLQKKQDLEDFGCANDDLCEGDTSPGGKDSKDAADSGRMLSAVSTIGFAVGAVGVGLGTYLLLTSGPSGETRAGIAPAPGGARFMLRQTF
jgi:hypothetical protein